MIHRHHPFACAPRLPGLGALLLIVGLPLSTLADDARLSGFWLEQPALPEAPAYSYYLLERDRLPQQRQGIRLQEELATLIDWNTLDGRTAMANGLKQWQHAVALHRERTGRTPARADLAALLASPRHDPTLTSLAEIGHCAVPDWVELWHFGGVIRQRWSPNLTLQALIRQRPRADWAAAEYAWLITPQGAPRRIGIAAWNAGDAPLVAGSRIVLTLPGAVQEADWVNRTLPNFLATRLPGDTCSALTPAKGPEPSASVEESSAEPAAPEEMGT
ncbi:capsule biosynthesis GfcC family protein [Billgrantia saliphila]|uniref:capsule biosynthesis GfcC family protein n=1 Tax=Billgrantia saliphila TaxID=1848458 RepID=UPI000CE42A6A|nr:capsule biosynthesis GfcC family protein [Halomonas saliphila]